MKKGFTLIELLAVLIILGVILSITYYSVDSILDTSSESLSDTQKRELEKSAELFYLQEGMDLNATCVTVSYLLSNKYIEHSEVVDPQTNQDIIGYISIQDSTYTFHKVNSISEIPSTCVS